MGSISCSDLEGKEKLINLKEREKKDSERGNV
jgi:hypothetical protein